MAIYEFDTEEEFEEAGERIEELNFQHLHLKEEVEEAEKNLEYAQEELERFEEDNREFLVGRQGVKTVKQIIEINIADCDGNPIEVGSVLKCIEDNRRGVVEAILEEGDIALHPIPQVGDVVIRTGYGTNTITNRYDKWQHIPHDEQTYMERYYSWRYSSIEPDYSDRGITREEAISIQGILALLPEDTVDYEFGDNFADNIEDALLLLAEYLTEQKR